MRFMLVMFLALALAAFASSPLVASYGYATEAQMEESTPGVEGEEDMGTPSEEETMPDEEGMMHEEEDGGMIPEEVPTEEGQGQQPSE